MNHILKSILLFSVLITFCSLSSDVPTTDIKDISVPEGYTVDVVAGPDLVEFPMFATIDETGRMFVFESVGNVYDKSEEAIENPRFQIKLLEDTNADGIYDKRTIFADKIGFPQGGVFYKGSLYASSAPDLLKLTDSDGDGVADKREVILTGWVLNVNANSLIGPFLGPDGWLYLTSAIMGFDVTTKEGKRLKGETSRIWRVRPDGSGLEWVSAGGMNNPVELTFTEAAEPIGTETYFTNPKAGQRDALVYWTEGGVYPKPNKNIDRDSLPRTGDLMPVVSKYSRVAPSGISNYRNTALGNDFKGNLFSAQFNTHRIIRHRLIREGASFRTEDEVFFSTVDEDFHPTDVLEDGAGSLLVVETGGWFIKGCPLSQVSKPELKGAIYRIRRKDAEKTVDPYGNKIAWPTLSPAQAAPYLSDKRPFVVDRAQQLLVDRGEEAVADLIKSSRSPSSAEVRAKSVFALYRIGTPKALYGVHQALSDPDLQVSLAAVRSVGLAKHKPSVNKLIGLLSSKAALALRRQAATALGQIGDPVAIPSLLASAASTEDRFVRHALIYALFSINRPELVANGLKHPSPLVVEASLIALDQMPGQNIQADQVVGLLSNTNKSLQGTALWVASHHPEWSKDIRGYLAKRFQKNILTPVEEESYRELLIALSDDSAIQEFVADQVQAASNAHQLLMLSVMAGSQSKEMPKPWADQVGKLLTSANSPQIQAKALELVRLRSVVSLNNVLRQFADDEKNNTLLRIEALSALTESDKKLKDTHFNYLYGQLNGKTEVSARLRAASTLSQANLSESQLLEIAQNYLPHADPFILPRLLPVFKGAYSTQVGLSLVSALMESPTLDSYSEIYLQKLFGKYPDAIKPQVEKLLAALNETHAERVSYLRSLEETITTGHVEEGRKLFFNKAACSVCHTVGKEGGTLGPDLTSIQRDRSPHDLLEAIVYPSVSFVREYETYKIKTRKNEYVGIISEKSPESIVLNSAPQVNVRIPRADILSMELIDTSIMPQGLDKALTQQEMADLMAFLLGQDQNPKADKAFLR